MFDWLKRLSGPARLEPECRWIVSIEKRSIRVIDDAGKSTSIPTDELSGVAIETNDSGPWGADLWWLFFGADGEMAGAFPDGATGQQEAIDFVSALPSFDHQAMIKAMGSTENAVFPVWRKA